MPKPLRAFVLSLVAFHCCIVAAQAYDLILTRGRALLSSPGSTFYQIFVVPAGQISLSAYACLTTVAAFVLWVSRLRTQAIPLDNRTVLATALVPGVPSAILIGVTRFVPSNQSAEWISWIWPLMFFGPTVVFVGFVVRARLRATPEQLRQQTKANERVSSFPQILIGVLVGGLSLSLCLFLAWKLHLMTQVRGWLPGGGTTYYPVTQLWHQTKESGGDVYWVSWDTTDIRVVGNHRLNVEQEVWKGLGVGDSFPVIRVQGTRMVFTRETIYASNGSFLFDMGLFTLGLLGMRLGLRNARRRSGTLSV